MKFVVRKTKSGFFEDEYQISLTDKTKDTIRNVYFGVCGVAAVVLVTKIIRDNPETENDPETTEPD